MTRKRSALAEAILPRKAVSPGPRPPSRVVGANDGLAAYGAALVQT